MENVSLHTRRRNIVAHINGLNEKEKKHIFHILHKNNVAFTKNNSGYFFNLTNMDQKVLETLEKCAEIIIKHREEIEALDEKREQQLKEYKESIRLTMEKRVQDNQIKDVNKLRVENYEQPFSVEVQRKQLYTRNREKDIDEIEKIMRANAKGPKYPKDSVYYKIMQRLNKRTKRVDTEVKQPTDTSLDSNDTDFGEENLDDAVPNVEIEPDLIPPVDNDDYNSNASERDTDSSTIYDDSGEADSYISNDEHDMDEVGKEDKEENEDNEDSEAVNNNATENNFNMKYTYFKTLLKQKGIHCIEAKERVRQEPYIVVSDGDIILVEHLSSNTVCDVV